MQQTFELIFPNLIESEGGFVHRSKAEDPGGATKYGVTLATLSFWRNRTVSVQEVKDLTIAEAKHIYKKLYWDAVKADALPLGLDYSVFDYGVNSGPGRAIKSLQTLIGTKADGSFGPASQATLAAYISRNGLKKTIISYNAGRLEYMKSLSNWQYNQNGWSRRVREVTDRSLILCGF